MMKPSIPLRRAPSSWGAHANAYHDLVTWYDQSPTEIEVTRRLTGLALFMESMSHELDEDLKADADLKAKLKETWSALKSWNLRTDSTVPRCERCGFAKLVFETVQTTHSRLLSRTPGRMVVEPNNCMHMAVALSCGACLAPVEIPAGCEIHSVESLADTCDHGESN